MIKRRRVMQIGSVMLTLLMPAASAYASERPAIGSRVPLPVLRDAAGVEQPLARLAGPRGIALLFWAAWSERSVEALERIDGVAAEMMRHGVGVVAINVERHAMSDADLTATRALVTRLKVRMPVLIDRGLELFKAYGVVTVPSTALVDGKGTLAYFLYGYALEQREELFDALDRLAGITRVRGRAMTAVPAAIRRLQLGRMQLAHGEAGPARESFEAAVKADPAFIDPLVELAALALDEQNLTGARAELDRAASLDASDRLLRRERARLLIIERHEPRAAEAEAALGELAATGTDPIAVAYLAYVLDAAGDAAGARLAFDRAKAAAGVDPRRFLRAGAADGVRITHAMTAFRREVAVRAR